jgi:hypothetical protein
VPCSRAHEPGQAVSAQTMAERLITRDDMGLHARKQEQAIGDLMSWLHGVSLLSLP